MTYYAGPTTAEPTALVCERTARHSDAAAPLVRLLFLVTRARQKTSKACLFTPRSNLSYLSSRRPISPHRTLDAEYGILPVEHRGHSRYGYDKFWS